MAVLQGQFFPDAGGHLFKAGNLPEGDFPVLVRAGQVRAQPFHVQAVQFPQAGEQFFKLVRQESAAAHARIHGDMDGKRLPVQPRQGIVVHGFLDGGDEGPPAVQHDFLPFLRKGGTQDIGPGAASRLADAPRFPHVGDSEEGDAFRIQGAADLFQPVTVGCRLYHGHVIFTLGRLLDDVQVMADGPEVDFGPGAGGAGNWHDGERRRGWKKERGGTLPRYGGIVRLCPCNARRIFVSLGAKRREDGRGRDASGIRVIPAFAVKCRGRRQVFPALDGKMRAGRPAGFSAGPPWCLCPRPSWRRGRPASS